MSRVYDFGLGGQFPDSSTKFLLSPNDYRDRPTASSRWGVSFRRWAVSMSPNEPLGGQAISRCLNFGLLGL
jgi:hypothetical protein